MIRKWLKRLLAVLLVLWLMVVVGLIYQIHTVGQIDERQSADVIIVLGAGLNAEGQAGLALTRRSLHGADLWSEGYARYVICTGGTSPKQTRSEAEACAEILQVQGIPETAILIEAQSLSTEENALHSQTLLQAADWQTALIVTDSFHAFRSRHIFQAYGMTVFMSPVPREEITGFPNYEVFLAREILAYHWQWVKEALDLPITHIP